MPRERRKRSPSHNLNLQDVSLVAGTTPTGEDLSRIAGDPNPPRSTRRSTVPAFDHPEPKHPRRARPKIQTTSSSSSSAGPLVVPYPIGPLSNRSKRFDQKHHLGVSPSAPSVPTPLSSTPSHVFHPSPSTAIARSNSSRHMVHALSAPLPTPISATSNTPPIIPSLPVPLVTPLPKPLPDLIQKHDSSTRGKGRSSARNVSSVSTSRRSRKDYETYSGGTPPSGYRDMAHQPRLQLSNSGLNDAASPARIDMAAASAITTAQIADQRSNRFHRAHRFERLPLTPRSRSPITFTFSGEPSEYFALWRGRRVRLPGPLPWPCDSLELERVEAQHWLTRLLLGYPFLGPVTEVLREKPDGRVLDVATGVGVWAMDVAEMFPWVKVVGCDNVPIQERETCENVEWDIVDLEDLPYEPESFDVIHIRFSHLRIASFPLLLKNAWRLLRRGGILLVFDTSSPPILSNGKTPTGAQAWTDAFHRSLQNAGMAPFKVMMSSRHPLVSVVLFQRVT
ncbi:hypothetical protein BD324DRAFT_344500 [Kockovaella imperatae]|uniref:Methyltransferase domain-containing protein n=1 Tax=Kockovaella imperatae TaxID=4999 RepID=A0A1Y1UM87_9TREE|nr:hypothetical protein BD324DRAFT_344500 [Kockovaella imperatae]ORX38245.1 hypothetical protein BD324DRAFT_344500 [Kockovaella imperatae]